MQFKSDVENLSPLFEVDMVEIKYGNCGINEKKLMNAKDRRKLARAKAHHEKLRAEKSLSIAITEALNGCPVKIVNALNGVTPRDDLLMPAEQKDDAFHHKVNHAHQRNP